MARGERQTQSADPAPVPAAVPATMPEAPKVESLNDPAGLYYGAVSQGPAIDALTQKMNAYEQEASIAERNAVRYRESFENSEAYAARCRADAEACRNAIQRLSN